MTKKGLPIHSRLNSVWGIFDPLMGGAPLPFIKMSADDGFIDSMRCQWIHVKNCYCIAKFLRRRLSLTEHHP